MGNELEAIEELLFNDKYIAYLPIVSMDTWKYFTLFKKNWQANILLHVLVTLYIL